MAYQRSNRLRRYEAATPDDHARKVTSSQHGVKAAARNATETGSGLFDRIQRAVHNDLRFSPEYFERLVKATIRASYKG